MYKNTSASRAAPFTYPRKLEAVPLGPLRLGTQEEQKLVAGGQVTERSVSPPPDLFQDFERLLVVDEEGGIRT